MAMQLVSRDAHVPTRVPWLACSICFSCATRIFEKSVAASAQQPRGFGKGHSECRLSESAARKPRTLRAVAASSREREARKADSVWRKAEQAKSQTRSNPA